MTPCTLRSPRTAPERVTVPLLLIATGLLGLAVGSFLNVVVHRVPLLASLSTPGIAAAPPADTRSGTGTTCRCSAGWCCAAAARTAERRSAPATRRWSWSRRVLFVAVTARLVQLGLVAALPAFLWFVAAGIALALIDLDVRRLPDVIMLPAYPVLAVLLIVAALVSRRSARTAARRPRWCGLLRALLPVALAIPGGMGFGDVKLAGLIGGMLAFVSWPVLLVGTERPSCSVRRSGSRPCSPAGRRAAARSRSVPSWSPAPCCDLRRRARSQHLHHGADAVMNLHDEGTRRTAMRIRQQEHGERRSPATTATRSASTSAPPRCGPRCSPSSSATGCRAATAQQLGGIPLPPGTVVNGVVADPSALTARRSRSSGGTTRSAAAT